MQTNSIPPIPQRRMSAVGLKLTLATTVVVLLVAAGVYAALTRFERDNLLRAKTASATVVVDLLVQAVAAPIVFEDETGLSDTLGFLRRNDDVVQAVVWRASEDGTPPVQLGAYVRDGASPPPLALPLEEGVSRDGDRLLVTDTVADPLGAPVAMATVVFSLERENAAFEALSNRILGASVAIALLFLLVLSLVSGRWIVRPLTGLARVARDLEKGRSTSAMPSSADDEIGDLGRALGRMADAIQSREKAIAKRNGELRQVLDNVGDGFLVIDAEGKVQGERSAVVDRWFGNVQPGTPFGEMIGRIDPNTGAVFSMGWDSVSDGFLPAELCFAQLPSRLRAGARHFAIEYRPLGGGVEGAPGSTIVVISDVTSEVERAAAEAAQRDFVQAVSGLVADRAGFVAFLQEARGLARKIECGHADRATAARDLHTLKGICATAGIARVAHVVHEVEDALTDDDKRLPTLPERTKVAEAWRAFDDRIRQVADVGGSTRIEVTPADLDEVIRALRDNQPGSRVASMVEEWRGELVSARLARLGEQARTLAQRLGKGDATVSVDAGTLRMPGEAWNSLFSTLVHVIRNAVDHGIEAPEDREAAGKGAPRFDLTARRTGRKTTITIADDGRGIDWERVRAKAQKAGLPAVTREDHVNALFHDGLSTRDEATELSGRGVGLGAVREAVQQLGGTIAIDSVVGHGTRFEITLPEADARTARRAA